MSADMTERITELLTRFKLPRPQPSVCAVSPMPVTTRLCPCSSKPLEADLGEIRVPRCGRLLSASRPPTGKPFERLDEKRLPTSVTPRLRELLSSALLERAGNVPCFGLPVTGKTHAAAPLDTTSCSAGMRSSSRRRSSSSTSCSRTKVDLALPRALRKLDVFEVIILDDPGYVQQSADEFEVLFTLMAERDERRSMIITSNLVFGGWGRIFKTP
jgi:DNA replication protein DnaC